MAFIVAVLSLTCVVCGCRQTRDVIALVILFTVAVDPLNVAVIQPIIVVPFSTSHKYARGVGYRHQQPGINHTTCHQSTGP